jgi:hypothetical protein
VELSGPLGNKAAQAIWSLQVNEESVPGGKKAWKAIAFSANRRFWLLQNAESGKRVLFQLTKN